MKLSEYYKFINEIDGRPNPEPNSRITLKDLNFNEGKGKEGSATITFLDGEPVALNWYCWDLDYNWLIAQIEHELSKKIKLVNHSGGNGHESAYIEIIENDKTSSDK